MKKLLLYSVAMALYCLLSACQSTKILTATFEADAIDSPPAKSLPADPEGDVIEYQKRIAPVLKVQNSAISGYKALHYTALTINNPPPVSARYLSFKGGHLMARMRIFPNGDVGLTTNIRDADYSDIIGNIGSEANTIVFTASLQP